MGRGAWKLTCNPLVVVISLVLLLLLVGVVELERGFLRPTRSKFSLRFLETAYGMIVFAQAINLLFVISLYFR